MGDKDVKIKRKGHWLLGLLISVILVVLIVRQIDMQNLIKTLKQSNLFLMVPFLGCVALFLWIKAERWRLLLRPLKVASLKEVFPSVVIGVSVNYLLFSYLGEFFRTYIYARDSGVAKSAVFGTIVLERILDAVFVLLLAGVAFTFSKSLPDKFIIAGYLLSLCGFLAAATVFFLVFFTESSLRLLHYLLFLFPLHLRNSFIKHVEEGIKGLHSLAHPKLLCWIGATSLAQWFLVGLCVYLCLLAVSIEVPFYASFITVAVMAFGVVLPSSPAQVGVLEFCFLLSLEIFGVPREKALAAALLFHFFLYFPVILLGLRYFRKMGISFSKVRKNAEEFRAGEE